ncbi:MAG: AIPR family protein [bacterium]|nr:AIPR family protein [bacterium]
MDRITKRLFEEYIADNSLGSIPEDEAFEHFAAFLATSQHVQESFTSEDFVVGSGGDGGIDSISVIVNGAVVTEPEEVDDYEQLNGYLDVKFVFVQATRASHFDASKIGDFAYGVCDFFEDRPGIAWNERVQHYSLIWKEILKRSRAFRKGNPQCCLYFVTTGEWRNDPTLASRVEAGKADLSRTMLFRNVSFECIDARGVQEWYRASQNAVSVEIVFENHAFIPDIPGVEQAYVGVLPAFEFLKLVSNEAGEMRSSVFYDNVRHWQEWNHVNKQIQRTLQSSEESIRFPLLNNGVTIVARRIQPTGRVKFQVEDFQVVNGCQTSYVLHECRHEVGDLDRVMIPVRLIATTDESIRNAIIRATNLQTEIKEEQFFALTEFPKRLEQFFPTFGNHKRLYYERRDRQYHGEGVEKVRVITLPILVRAFASVFMEIPHSTTRSYKSVLQKIGTAIFRNDHKLDPYYVAAYMFFRMESFFRRQHLDKKFRPARYHILLAFKKLAIAERTPDLSSGQVERYCGKLMELLWDEGKSRSLFEEAAKVVELAAKGDLGRDRIRTERFTTEVLQELSRRP